MVCLAATADDSLLQRELGTFQMAAGIRDQYGDRIANPEARVSSTCHQQDAAQEQRS